MTTRKLFNNAKQEPKVYYCKHIAAGVCGYEDETILITNDTLKKMDATFAGKPVYVDHQKVQLETLQQDADGYVAESFFLPEDGCHWAKFIVVSDKGHEAVDKGFAVSNAYIPESFGVGGEWHNIKYNREITDGYYTHLALVANPRYEEAEIMTPEDFKAYKEAKRAQLNQLQNSKDDAKEKKSMANPFKLFTRKEVTNSEELSEAMVELKDGKTMSIKEIINAVEETKKEEEKEKEDKKNEEEVLSKKIKVNGEEITVKELIDCYEASMENEEEVEEEEVVVKKDKKNTDKEEEKEEDEKKDKKNSKLSHFDALLNAAEKHNAKKDGIVIDTVDRKLARGQERYGSEK
ncbi:hypothetical protein AAIR98_000898 [Elusimicrobium simillimum]|uniref:hypothetical protein n=1 Tax=Elusimicrobium simillimum TaxID=3143438 RepID=UPI003C6EE548